MLKQQGNIEDFNLKENYLECRKGQYAVFHDEFDIDKWFCIEGDDSSADGSSILYAICSKKYGLRGTMVNVYGIYSDGIADEMLSKLNFA